MDRKLIMPFLAGCFLSAIGFSFASHFLSESEFRYDYFVVNDSQRSCLEGIIKYKGEVVTESNLSFPEYLSGTTLLKIKAKDEYRDISKHFGTCFSRGYMKSYFGDQFLWTKLQHYQSQGDRVFLHNEFGTENITVYVLAN